jgi:AraC-like DNA-binding protein
MIVAILADIRGSIHHEYGSMVRQDVRYYGIEHGMEAAGDRAAELAILDCGRIPDVCIELLREIKENHPDLPVVFVTEVSSEEVAIQAYKTGARDYFRKPVDVDEFRMSIEKILRFRLVCREHPDPDATGGETSARGDEQLCDVIPGGIMRALCFIENNLSNPFNLDEIAAVACLSKFHFCRLFKKYLGSSPVRFAIHRRLLMAKTLLHRGDRQITTVAVQSGFSDLSEFNRQFKKTFGVSPSHYRVSRKSDDASNPSSGSV